MPKKETGMPLNMKNIRTVLILAALVLMTVMAPAFAGTLKLKKGTSLDCTLMDRDRDLLYFDCPDGMKNFYAREIESFDGRPVESVAVGGPAASPAFESKSSATVPVPGRDVIPAPATDPGMETYDKGLAYYNSHREKFKTPVSVHLEGIEFMSKPSDQEAASARSGSWKDTGWFEQGDAMGDHRLQDVFGPEASEVFNLGAGQVSGLLRGPGGTYYLLRVVERKEPVIPPYDEIVGKVKFEMLNEASGKG